MFSAVMNDPTYTRAGFKPRFLSHSRAAFAATCSSIDGVAPSELIITATLGAGGGFGGFTSVVATFSSPVFGGLILPSRHFMYPLFVSVIFSSNVPTSVSTFVTGTVAAPGSPWIPRPSSIFPGGIVRAGADAPGSVCAATATPTVPTHAAACIASSFTAVKPRPELAAAPATLCTKSVPANPRLPATPSGGGSAQSSPTTTISTLYPSSLARSAARPKFKRSPV
mmetsp:Transcript_4326/g.17238  ORF Transcript_4326/g.17238 Transcript_4326/m.17238 type:complete len:225 (-) Transcript_4326:502-1176(-)